MKSAGLELLQDNLVLNVSAAQIPHLADWFDSHDPTTFVKGDLVNSAGTIAIFCTAAVSDFVDSDCFSWRLGESFFRALGYSPSPGPWLENFEVAGIEDGLVVMGGHDAAGGN